MEPLGVLAVAARDIRALSTARADSGPLRRLPSGASPPRPSSPPGDIVCGAGYRTFHVVTACETIFPLVD